MQRFTGDLIVRLFSLLSPHKKKQRKLCKKCSKPKRLQRFRIRDCGEEGAGMALSRWVDFLKHQMTWKM